MRLACLPVVCVFGGDNAFLVIPRWQVTIRDIWVGLLSAAMILLGMAEGVIEKIPGDFRIIYFGILVGVLKLPKYVL